MFGNRGLSMYTTQERLEVELSFSSGERKAVTPRVEGWRLTYRSGDKTGTPRLTLDTKTTKRRHNKYTVIQAPSSWLFDFRLKVKDII